MSLTGKEKIRFSRTHGQLVHCFIPKDVGDHGYGQSRTRIRVKKNGKVKFLLISYLLFYKTKMFIHSIFLQMLDILYFFTVA